MAVLKEKLFIAKAPWPDRLRESGWVDSIKSVGFNTVVMDEVDSSWLNHTDDFGQGAFSRETMGTETIAAYKWMLKAAQSLAEKDVKFILDIGWFLDFLVKTKPESATGSVYNGSQSFTQYQQFCGALRRSGILDAPNLLYVRIKSTPNQPKWGTGYDWPASTEALLGFYNNVAGQLRITTPGGKTPLVSYGAFEHLDGNGGVDTNQLFSAARNDICEITVQHQWDYKSIDRMANVAAGLGKSLVIAYNSIEQVEPDSGSEYFNIVKGPQARADKLIEWAPSLAHVGVKGYGTGLVDGAGEQYGWQPGTPGWDALKRFAGYFLRGEPLNQTPPPVIVPPVIVPPDIPADTSNAKRIDGLFHDPFGRVYISSMWSAGEYHDGGTKENGVLIQGPYKCRDGEVRVSSHYSDTRRYATRIATSRTLHRRSRALWLTTMYGVGDQNRWVKDPKSVGFDMVRVTDIIERDVADLSEDPEKKFDEVRAKLDAYLAADIGVLLDLSFVRNLVENSLPDDHMSNVYDHYATFQAYEAAIALCKRSGVWNHPAIQVISIAGEPDAPNWGKTKRHPKSHEHLMFFYRDVAEMLIDAGWAGPISSGGVMHFDGGSGLDFAKLAAEPWNHIVTVHIYNESDVRYLPKAAEICKELGKPLWVEEFGVKVVPTGDLEFAQTKTDAERAKLFASWFELFAELEIEGVGLWNLGDGDGHSVQLGRDNDSVKVLREWIIRTGKF